MKTELGLTPATKRLLESMPKQPAYPSSGINTKLRPRVIYLDELQDARERYAARKNINRGN